MGPLPKKAHWPPFYIYLQSAAIALSAWYFMHARYQDDAYITLTYARNLLAGEGFTWSGERIEGYSNFLFLVLTVLLGASGIDLQLASNIINFTSYLGLIAVIHFYANRHYRRHFSESPNSYAHRINHALCTSMVASSLILLAWCFGGLETVFFAFLLTSAICMILNWMEHGTTNWLAFMVGVLFALAAMTRVEAIAIWGITGLFLGGIWLIRKRASISFRQLALFGLGFLLLFAPYTGWRLSYFGEWLPNTYYAKLYGIPSEALNFAGFFYFLQFIIMPPMLFLFAAFVSIIAFKGKSLSLAALYLAFIALGMCAQVIRAGGDHMHYLRFFVPVVPVLALLAYHCNAVTLALNEKRFRDICGAFLIFSIFQLGMVRTYEGPSTGAVSAEAVAAYIKDYWPAGSLIALNPAGALPYLAPEYRYLDMIGLLDKHIAKRTFTTPDEVKMVVSKPPGHMKGDGKYVLSRKPDYIIFGNAIWGSETPIYTSDMEIAQSPEFKKLYEKEEVYVTSPSSLIPILHQLADENAKAYETQEKNVNFIRNPVLNSENQLRFIYYQRKKDSK